jgi:hypothetical protein
MLRSGILADLILRPWPVPDSVAAHLEVQVPLGALTPERLLVSGAPPSAAFARPGTVAEPTGTPITAAHVRDLLAQHDATGLRTPPNGSMPFSFTDENGAPRADATLRDLRRVARRGGRELPAGDCGCPVLDRPEPTDAYQPTAAQRRFLTTRDRRCRHPGCDHKAGWADADHVLPRTPTAAPPTAPTCVACAATTGSRPTRPAGPTR